MSKIIIMQGLPASGKTTLAKELSLQQGAVRINKDSLRAMLHFDRFTGKNEGMTRDAARLLATHFLKEEVNVIIDDTNLNERTLQSWKDLGKEHASKIEYRKLETPLEECLARDAARENSVGRSVIIGMALASGIYPKPEKPVVLCDLDGTLCDITHRLHYVQVAEGEKKDWKGFFAQIPGDTLREDTAKLLEDYKAKGHQIFFISARPDNYRKETEAWLHSALPTIAGEALFMRSANDSRPDTEVKSDMFDRLFKNVPIEMIIDDRPAVIRMWREKGLPVTDVGAGVEF